jgi:uncharacterized protein (DUF433 family)
MPGHEVLRTETSWIQKTPGVCGGQACIRTLRLPVWSVVQARRLGATDEELLNYFVVPLTPADVQAAWTYYDQNREEIEDDIRQNTEEA